jgi:hypothetical protein
MSWHDPDRIGESQADSALRNELRGLLGIAAGPANYFETEVTPELAGLADELRREAQRRNRTVRHKHSWMLLAAALPFALTLGAVGTWGVAQKQKADGLAAALTRQEAQIQQLAATVRTLQPAQPAQPLQVQAPASKTLPAPSAQMLAGRRTPAKPKELVIPVERSTEINPGASQTVKSVH